MKHIFNNFASLKEALDSSFPKYQNKDFFVDINFKNNFEEMQTMVFKKRVIQGVLIDSISTKNRKPLIYFVDDTFKPKAFFKKFVLEEAFLWETEYESENTYYLPFNYKTKKEIKWIDSKYYQIHFLENDLIRIAIRRTDRAMIEQEKAPIFIYAKITRMTKKNLMEMIKKGKK